MVFGGRIPVGVEYQVYHFRSEPESGAVIPTPLHLEICSASADAAGGSSCDLAVIEEKPATNKALPSKASFKDGNDGRRGERGVLAADNSLGSAEQASGEDELQEQHIG